MDLSRKIPSSMKSLSTKMLQIPSKMMQVARETGKTADPKNNKKRKNNSQTSPDPSQNIMHEALENVERSNGPISKIAATRELPLAHREARGSWMKPSVVDEVCWEDVGKESNA